MQHLAQYPYPPSFLQRKIRQHFRVGTKKPSGSQVLMVVTRVNTRMFVTQGYWVTGWEVAGWETEPRLMIEVG